MEKAIKWFSENHVAANFCMLLVLLAGFTTWFKLRKEIFPETALDAVIVQVAYPNATAEEVETGVVSKIEDVIADLDGVKRYTSTAMESVAAVTVEVATGYDVREVMDDVKSAVDSISEFPDRAEKPVVSEAKLNSQVLSLTLSGDVGEMSLRKAAETVRDGLLAHRMRKPEGFKETMLRKLQGEAKITKVSLSNVRPYEISIEIPEKKLQQYGLTLAQVAQSLKASSLDLPSGSIREKAGELVIRTEGKIRSAEGFLNATIYKNPDGSELKLSAIANVVDGFEDVDLKTRFDGRNAVVVNVYRTGEQDTSMIVTAVKDYIERVAPTQLPAGIQIELWNDMSKMLEGRMNLLLRSGSSGLILVFIVLAMFLRPSLALLVAIGIPVSFAGGVWLMPMVGVSVNMISLFAFILVLGIVVDDAIVVGENIYTRIQGGEDPKKAAWMGTHEVGVVVIFGVLTTMAAFTPMIGLSGVSGKIWPNIPLVVIPVLFFSLLQSKLVLPAHAAFLKPHNRNNSPSLITQLQHKIADGLEWFIEHMYRPFLKFCLRWRYIVVACFTAILVVIIGLVASKRVPFIFLPKVEGDLVTTKLEMPVGYEFSKTDEAVQNIAKAAERVGARYKDDLGNPVLLHKLSTTGSQPFHSGFSPADTSISSHLGEVTLQLSEAKNRSQLSTAEFINAWREEIGTIPGAVELSFREETGAGGNAIDIEISGKDLKTLEAAANYLTSELGKMVGVKDINTDRRLGKYELVFDDKSLTPLGRSKGFTLASVTQQIRAYYAGIEIQRIQRGKDEVKVLLRYPDEERRSMQHFEEIKLTTPQGEQVPLMEVIKGRMERGYSTVKHVNGQRAIKISADVNRDLANAKEVSDTFTEEHLDVLSEKFPGVGWDYLGEQKDQNDSLNEMGQKFIGALLLIYVLMAVPLRSYTQPLIVMCVIPFGFVGAVLGHMLLGMELSIMSMCGIIALAGVVVNDSLVLVDYVNRSRAQGLSVIEATWNAGARRFRPILLTSLTTFMGLLPMLMETDMQARFLIPMAVSLGFGILFATAITLILVPSVYIMLNDVKKIFSK